MGPQISQNWSYMGASGAYYLPVIRQRNAICQAYQWLIYLRRPLSVLLGTVIWQPGPVIRVLYVRPAHMSACLVTLYQLCLGFPRRLFHKKVAEECNLSAIWESPYKEINLTSLTGELRVEGRRGRVKSDYRWSAALTSLLYYQSFHGVSTYRLSQDNRGAQFELRLPWPPIIDASWSLTTCLSAPSTFQPSTLWNFEECLPPCVFAVTSHESLLEAINSAGCRIGAKCNAGS